MPEPILPASADSDQPSKICSQCKTDKPLNQFSPAKHTRDKRTSWCHSCANDRNKQKRATPAGLAGVMWYSLLRRLRVDKAYVDVELRISRRQFVEWATPLLTAWLVDRPDDRPSVDRVITPGHYELSNMRLLELGENSRRKARNHNVHAPAGQAWCGKCRRYYDRSSFYKSADRPHGVTANCKKCQAKQDHEKHVRTYVRKSLR